MNPELIDRILDHPIARAIGWSLVHFIWQGVLIGAAAALAFLILRRATSQARYLAGCAALILMALAPVATTLATLPSFATTDLLPGGIASIKAITPLEQSAFHGGLARQDPVGRLELFSPARSSSEAVSAWIPSILGAWLIGVLLLSLRLVAGWTLLHHRVQREITIAAPIWQQRLSRLSTRMGIAQTVRLIESARAEVPCSMGWLRPIVLLPASALAGLSPDQLEAILAHELAHIRRHDYIANLLQTAVETLLFYHPAVWWVSRRVRVEREYCCDDWAVAVCGDTVGYARALADLEHLRQPSASLALAATGGSLLTRVRRLLGASEISRGKGPHWEVAVVVLLLLAGLAAGSEAVGGHDMAAIVISTGMEQAPPSAPPVPPLPKPQAQSSARPVPAKPAALPAPPAPASVPAPVALPALPSAPAPPTVPAPPQPASSFAGLFDRLGGLIDGFSRIGSWSRMSGSSQSHWSWSDNGRGLDVRTGGTIAFTDDETDVKSISAGGYLIVTVRDGGTTTYDVRPNGDGSLERLWNGKPAGPEARAWLARVLPEFLRQSGFNAEARVTRLLAQKGPAGVLDEVTALKSSYVKRIYIDKLFAKAKLDPAMLARAIRQIGSEISSDYERASALVHAGKLGLPDEACRMAFAEATRTMKSDYEKHRALSALIAAGPITPPVAGVVIESARTMKSDYELAGLLVQVNRTQAMTPAAADLALTLADGIKSDYERHRALSALLKGRTLDEKTQTRLLDSSARMKSDYELAGLLRELLQGQRLAAPSLDALFKAVATIGSDYERAQVLTAALALPSPTMDLRARVIQSAATMKNDYERANVLIAAARGAVFDSTVRKAYLAVADTIKSEYERNRALAALARTQE